MADEIDDLELDQILSILENPIRRRILMKLSRDTNYPLQLSKELNVSQQAIMKHLKVLEENDFVVSFEERSDKGGPPRKIYAPRKRYCVRIDIGPNTYSENFYSYRSYEIDRTVSVQKRHTEPSRLSVSGKITGEMKSDIVAALPAFTDPSLEELRMKLEKMVYEEEDLKKVGKVRDLLSSINDDILRLESRRKSLLAIRERTFQEANSLIIGLSNSNLEKDILALYLIEGITDTDVISERLNIRKSVIDEAIKGIRFPLR